MSSECLKTTGTTYFICFGCYGGRTHCGRWMGEAEKIDMVRWMGYRQLNLLRCGKWVTHRGHGLGLSRVRVTVAEPATRTGGFEPVCRVSAIAEISSTKPRQCCTRLFTSSPSSSRPSPPLGQPIWQVNDFLNLLLLLTSYDRPPAHSTTSDSGDTPAVTPSSLKQDLEAKTWEKPRGRAR